MSNLKFGSLDFDEKRSNTSSHAHRQEVRVIRPPLPQVCAIFNVVLQFGIVRVFQQCHFALLVGFLLKLSAQGFQKRAIFFVALLPLSFHLAYPLPRRQNGSGRGHDAKQHHRQHKHQLLHLTTKCKQRDTDIHRNHNQWQYNGDSRWLWRQRFPGRRYWYRHLALRKRGPDTWRTVKRLSWRRGGLVFSWHLPQSSLLACKCFQTPPSSQLRYIIVPEVLILW